MAVVAKFRCLSVMRSYDGSATWVLKPVKRPNKKDEINNAFWEYTPSGSLSHTTRKNAPDVFELGAYYEITLTPDAEGLFTLTGSDYSWDNATFKFTHFGREPDSTSTELEMQLSTKATGARAAFAQHGSRWSVAWVQVEASDGPAAPLYGG